MSSVFLKSLSTENFASFAERVIFTTVADTGKKEYMENTFMTGDDVLNRVTYIYGANGSGKTFFCKILREIQRLIKWSPLMGLNNSQILSMPEVKGMDNPVSSFAYEKGYSEKPTFFGIDIVMDEITYHYEFSIHGKKILSESLSKKYRRTEKLLVRESPLFKSITLRSELKPFEGNLNVVKEEALCLPMAAFLNNPLASSLVNAIQSINVLSMTAARLNPFDAQVSFSEERIAKYTRILQKMDPTLRKITVTVKEEETARHKLDSDDFENRELIGRKTTVGINAEHAVFEGEKEVDSTNNIDFFGDESLGTVKLFTALPYLYDVLENGGVLVVDEIENGLHLSLVKDIIQLFIDASSNPNGAQLICTSHQPLLIADEVRRDQVWIVSKDHHGKSSLHRMSELSTSRSKINLSNRLLDGAFGYCPKPFFDSNT